MKKGLLIIAIILSLFLICSCSNKINKNEIKIGKYLEVINEMAWVELKENNEYEFCRHIATSYVPSGKYIIEDGQLILKAGETEEYKFEINGDKLIFISGTYIGDLLKAGAVFQFSEKDI